MVNCDTEIIIEGYPRSANTFAVAAFEYSQRRKACIARHTHAPAQIFQGVKHSIPVILLIRNPKDAVVSLVIRDQTMTLRKALISYLWYHQAILAYVDKCVVAEFSKVVTNYSQILEQVNKKYGKNYTLFEHDNIAEKSIFELVENMERADSGGTLRESHVARPSASRREIKRVLSSELSTSSNMSLLEQCDSLYRKILA